MHACEAMLAAFDATSEMRYLERAATLAHNITVRQAALALVREGYLLEGDVPLSVAAGARFWDHFTR